MNKKYYHLLLTLLLSLLLQNKSFSQVAEKGLISFWTFDSSQSDVKSNLIPLESKNICFDYARNKKSAGCLKLSDNSYLSFYDVNDSLNFKKHQTLFFTFWMKADTKLNDSDRIVFSNNFSLGSKGNGYAFFVNKKGNVDFVIRTKGKAKNDIHISGNSNIADGRWHHVMMSIENGKNIFLYIDNKDELTYNYLNSTDSISCNTFFIGCSSKKDKHFAGWLDDFRVYNYVLKPTERLELFNEGTNTNNFEIELNNPLSANNSCTFILSPNPNRDKVLLNTGKYQRMVGYSVHVINRKAKEVDHFNVDKGSFEFDLEKWGGADYYFFQVFDPAGDLVNTFKVNLK